MQEKIGIILKQMGESLVRSELPQYKTGGDQLLFIGEKIIAQFPLAPDELQFVHDFIESLTPDNVAPSFQPVVAELKALYRAEATQ